MLNGERVLILVINSLGFILALIALILILKTKYKDFSNYAVMMLISYDLTTAFFGILGAFGTGSIYCNIVLFFLFYARQCHAFLIFLIGYSLFSVIVKEKDLNIVFVKIIIVIGNIFTISFALASILLNSNHSNLGFCVLENSLSVEEIILFLIGAIFPSALVLISIIYYYYNIRLKLKAEAEVSNLKSTRNRIFAKRLLGYCLIFIFYFIPFLIVVEERKIQHANSRQRYLIQMVAVGLYPILNSLMYGSTKSIRRNFFNMCIKGQQFDVEEEMINEMREEGILQPRYYLDLIDESESQIINSF